MSAPMSVVSEAVRFSSGEWTLVGVLHRPGDSTLEARSSNLEPRTSNLEHLRPAVAICHPHPLYGGDMENNVVVSLCGALADAGVAALRFNFRGVGGSGGSHGGGIGERQDARAALDFLTGLAEVDGGRLGLAGYSFGGLVALTAADERIRALVAVSPPSGALDAASCRPGIPTLLVSGDEDDIAPAARLPEMAASLGPACEVRSVAGADHFWWGREEALATTVIEFFRDRLPASEP